MSTDHVATEYDGTVAVMRLNRPPANAVDLEFVSALEGAFSELIAAGTASAVVFTGTGSFFCAGLDLKRVPFYGPDEQRAMVTTINRTLARLYTCPVPVVAAINGHAVAGGLVFALACDYRVGTSTPCQFGLTEARAGIPFPAVAMTIVQAELTPQVARILTLRANNSGPRAALDYGVLDELQPSDSVLPAAMAVARDLAGMPRGAYTRIKHQLRAATIHVIEDIVASGSDPMLASWVSPDAGAASTALLRSAKRTEVQ